MSNDNDRDVYVPDMIEDARFFSNELAVMANDLARALITCGSEQEAALGSAIRIARVSGQWSFSRQNLRGPSQALMELAKRLAWRDGTGPIVVADIPRLVDVSTRARRIEHSRFLSQHSEAVAAFKSAMAEMDRDWSYERVRCGLRVISGGRVSWVGPITPGTGAK